MGSGTIGALWRPAALKGYSRGAQGAIMGGIGVGVPLVTGGFVLKWLGLDANSADVAMFVGFVMSILSVIFAVTVTNYYKKHEDKDLFEVVGDVTAQAGRVRRPAARKPAARKPAAKKTTKAKK